MSKVRVLLVGGTIATVVKNNSAQVLNLTEELLHCAQYSELAEVDVKTFSQIGGLNITIYDVLKLIDEVKIAADDETIHGVVVVLGTNVMEEIAFSIQLAVQTSKPIVCTGAMRTPDMLSPDGPGNLLSAIAVAADSRCCNLGTMIVFNDEIHSADYAKKMHPSNPGAFHSECLIGYVSEGIPSIRTIPVKRTIPWIHVSGESKVKDVLLYTTCFSDSGRLLDESIKEKYAGIVVEGTGGGCVSNWIFDRLEEIHQDIPIVFASRIGCGDVMTGDMYGNAYGSAPDRVKKGYLFSGILDGRKARVLLMLLLMSGCTKANIQEAFNMYSKEYSFNV